MTFNTGNPVPSTDARDFMDNVQNTDVAVNTQELTWTDRLGVSRKTFAGMEAEFDSDQAGRADRFETFLLSSGYQDLGSYAAGLVITERNQVFRRDGEFYRAAAALQLPYTMTGDWVADGPKFVSVGDAVLRQLLSSPEGSAAVQHGSSTVAASLTASPMRYGAKGDGSSSDSAAFTSLEAAIKGQLVDLRGGTYVVDAVPQENGYFNGSFKVGGFTKPALLSLSPFNAAPRFQLNGGQLSRLRYSLSNPLEQFTSIVFIGDSITWGAGNPGEQASTDPSTRVLSAARDFFSTSSYVNIFKRWIGSNYFDNAQPIISNWPDAASGESTVEYKRNIVLWPTLGGFNLTFGGTSVASLETFVDPAGSYPSPTFRRMDLRYTAASPENPHSINFKFTGKKFSLFYGVTDTSLARYEVLVNGVSQGVFTNQLGIDGAVFGNANERIHAFDFVKNADIEIRSTNWAGGPTVRSLIITGIGIEKTCRIINNGINGQSARQYTPWCLTAGTYTPLAAVQPDDSYVFCQLGTNDRSNPSSAQNVPIPGAENVLYHHLQLVLNKIAEISHAEPILMVANPAPSDVPQTRVFTMQQVRGEIMKLAKDLNIDFIDNYSIFQGLAMRRYATDLLHPNYFGYSVMASNIIGALEQS